MFTQMYHQYFRNNIRRRIVTCALGLILLFGACFATAATFTVMTDGDGPVSPCIIGDCNTLRDAIVEANNLPGPDDIEFNIPGVSEVKTIALLNLLPPITSPIVINGYSQTGAKPNTNSTTQGLNTTLVIELDGDLIGNAFEKGAGLEIRPGAAGSTVQGLVIKNFESRGILLFGGGNNKIFGNFLGTDFDGVIDAPNGVGIGILDSVDNMIGSSLAKDRNLISGNSHDGVTITGSASTGNLVAGNLIGTDVTGNVELANKIRGVLLTSEVGVDSYASSNVIGGSVPGARNIISGNRASGVVIIRGTSNILSGNYIGLNVGGDKPLQNEDGIHIIEGSRNTIGGTEPGAGNVISGNRVAGIEINAGFVADDPELGKFQTNASNNVIAGNFIGTDASGQAAIANDVAGILISSKNGNDYSAKENTIGVPGTVMRNVISGNDGPGIKLDGENTYANQIQNNFIGIAKDGIKPLGNLTHGVFIRSGAQQNLIGGSPAGGNEIAFNGGGRKDSNDIIEFEHRNGSGGPGSFGHGVLVETGTGNTIRYNKIFTNEGRGIDLGEDKTFTINDVKRDIHTNVVFDGDEGANDLQNYPVVINVEFRATDKTITWMLHSSPGDYRVDFYGNDAPDQSGFGEGKYYLKSGLIEVRDVMDENGVIIQPTLGARGVITETFPRTDRYISTTVTDSAGSTSEFSMVDTDGDALADSWEVDFFDFNEDDFIDENERGGIDIDEDGKKDFTLPDPDPNRKNIYVEIDSMQGMEPFPSVIADIVQAFNTVPNVSINNPNDANGIALRLDVDDIVPIVAWSPYSKMRGTIPPEFYEYKNGITANHRDGWFGTSTERNDTANWKKIRAAKNLVYHYMFMAYQVGSDHEKYVATAELAEGLGGNDVVLAISYARNWPNYENIQKGTMMHELGHNLGLGHGGGSNVLGLADGINYKPNYHSVMNYTWQTETAWMSEDLNGNTVLDSWESDINNDGKLTDSLWRLDYSHRAYPTMDEEHLNELVGIGGDPESWVLRGPRALFIDMVVRETGHSDWNRNGSIEIDIGEPAVNNWKKFEENEEVKLEVLKGRDDWSNLRYYFIESPPEPEAVSAGLSLPEPELNGEDLLEFESLGQGPGYVRFGQVRYLANEGDGNISIQVVRGGGTDGTITVDYSVTPISAGAGSDYTPVTGTITFAETEYLKTFDVPILNDGIDEGIETAQLLLSNPTGDAVLLSGQEVSELQITDDDGPGTLQFSAPFLNVSETDGVAAIEVVRTAGSDGETMVDYFSADDTAIGGTDYLITSGTLTFAPGQTSATFTISILPDLESEITERVLLSLANPTSGAVLGDFAAINLNIIDDDGPGVFGVAESLVDVNEGVGTATVEVVRTGGTNGQVTVDYATIDSTAVAGLDYTATSGTLTFNDGEASKTFPVPILEDPFFDPDETLVVTIGNPTGGATIGSDSGSLLNIIDNDEPSVLEFGTTLINVNEDSGIATVEVVRTGNTNGKAEADFFTADQSATAGVDYTATLGTLTFNDGETLKSFTIPILDDVVPEPDETVLLTLSNPIGAVIGTINSSQVNIVDDNDELKHGSLGFTSASFTVNEIDGSATIEVVRQGGITGTVSIDFATSDVTALAGSDYSVTSGTLTFGDGELIKSFTIPVLDNSLLEGDKTLGLTLSSPTGGASLGIPSAAELSIIDNEALGAETFVVTSTADTGDGSLRQAISLSNGKPGPDFIHFDIPGTGVHTISPLSVLPAIIDPVTIDGYTQPGTHANTLSEGNDAVLLIEIDGEGLFRISGQIIDGLYIAAGNSVVRGLSISNFPDQGIELRDGDGNVIEGNFIGVGASGSALQGNDRNGIKIDGSSQNIVGGTSVGARNVISNNTENGIEITNISNENHIQGNFIGTAADGISPHGNERSGIVIAGSNNLIGGTAAEGNTVAFNGYGISVGGISNAIRGNAIFSNHRLGILSPTSASFLTEIPLNDPGDHTGANKYQNYPVLFSAVRSAGNTIIQGTLDSTGSSTFILEFFSSAAPHITGFGEGRALLGTEMVTTDSVGRADFSVTFPVDLPNGRIITATATDPEHNTSGFSRRLAVGDPVFTVSTFTVNSSDDTDDGICDGDHCSLREAIQGANTHPGSDFIHFDIPGAGVHTINLLWQLPTITDPVTIDGYTQPGASPNTLADGNDAVLLIEITGTNDESRDKSGLDIISGNSTVRGLVINRRFGSGITGAIRLAFEGGNHIEGNFIGTDPTGTGAPGAPSGDLSAGVGVVMYFSSDNTIGGTAPEERNLIAGMWENSIAVRSGARNRIQGNYIGTDRNGTGTLLNVGHGVLVDNASDDTVIGGLEPGAGNVISGFSIRSAGVLTSAIRIDSPTSTLVQGNYIGTDRSGTVILENEIGIKVSPRATATIGGTEPGARNVISGSRIYGIEIEGDSVLVQGNLIGTDVTGTVDLGSKFSGLQVSGDRNRIGGPEPGAGNVVSGNGGGIIIQRGSDDNIVQGNLVGTDVTGTVTLGNNAGVGITGNGNIIGGIEPGERNVISGNEGVGVSLNGSTNLFQGNLIGTQIDGASPLGNTQDGVRIGGNDNTIGGADPATGNIIAFNGGNGVSIQKVFASDPFGIGNAILSNSILANIGLGIDLNGDGVTPNDIGDGDTDANNLQNYPVLISAVGTASSTTIAGTLNSIPDTPFRLEFFANSASDPSGHGEGQRFIGSADVTTDGSGDVSFTVTLPVTMASDQVISATATGPGNNTSEFSQRRLEAGAGVSADLTITQINPPAQVFVGQRLTYTLSTTNSGPDTADGVTLTHLLPAGVTFESATPSQGTCYQAGGTVICNLGSIGDGATLSVDISVIPTETGPVTITENVTANQSDPDTANNTASNDTTVDPAADLSVEKSGFPDPVFEGRGLRYTLTVANDGPSAATGVTLVDTLPETMNFFSVLVPSSQGNCTEADGIVTCDLGSLGAGASVTVTIVVSADAAGTVTNTAQVTGEVTDPNTGNNTASAENTVKPAANLWLTKSGTPDIVALGETLTYTLAVTNSGPADAVGVSLTDTLPADLIVDAVTSSQGSCIEVNGTINCDLGDLANGATATVEIVVTPTGVGTLLTNTAEVTAASPEDPVQSDNTATVDNIVAAGCRAGLYGAAHLGPDGLSTLYAIDPATGNFQPVMLIGYERVTAMDFDPVSQKLYATGERPDGTDTHVLISIDPCSATVAEVGPTDIKEVSGNTRLTDVSFRNSDNGLFSLLMPREDLGRIDLTTGAASLIGSSSIPGCCGNGMAYSPEDTLYYANDSVLNILDPTTGAGTFVADLVFSPPADNFPRINAMDFNPETGVLFGALNDGSGDENYLSIVDTETGVVSIIGPTVNGLAALAFFGGQTPPVAHAGTGRNVEIGLLVTLDGSGSFDPDGDLITYDWSMEWQLEAIPADSLLTNDNIEGRTTPSPSFTPDVEGVYVFQLTVNDGQEDSEPDFVEITAFTPNVPPNANAGEDQTAFLGDLVFLDGSASNDSDKGPATLSFTWVFGEVPPNSFLADSDISGANQPQASFMPDVAGPYVLNLLVTDGEDSDNDEVTAIISELNVPPNAIAGSDQTVFLGQEVLLDGTDSYDPDGGPEPLTFNWRFVSVPEGSTLTNDDIVYANTIAWMFLPDMIGTFVLELEVFDGQANNFDNVMIEVTDVVQVAVDDLFARAKSGKIQIVWTPKDGAINYNIYRSTAGKPFELLAEGYVTNYATYLDFGLTNDVEYCFEVTWLDGIGQESGRSNTACATPLSRRIRTR